MISNSSSNTSFNSRWRFHPCRTSIDLVSLLWSATGSFNTWSCL